MIALVAGLSLLMWVWVVLTTAAATVPPPLCPFSTSWLAARGEVVTEVVLRQDCALNHTIEAIGNPANSRTQLHLSGNRTDSGEDGEDGGRPAVAMSRASAAFNGSFFAFKQNALLVLRDLVLLGAGAESARSSSDLRGAFVQLRYANMDLFSVRLEGGVALSGGAVYADAYSNIRVQDTVIANCTALGNGGALYLDDHATIRIGSGVTLLGNSAIGDGGALYAPAGASTFIDGHAFHASLPASSSSPRFPVIVEANRAGRSGGHVFLLGGSSLTLAHATLVGGTALGGNGGGIYASGSAIVSLEKGAVITRNEALLDSPVCSCLEQWSYRGDTYFGCQETPDWEGHYWCYLQSLVCSSGINTYVTGETKHWRECDPGES